MNSELTLLWWIEFDRSHLDRVLPPSARHRLVQVIVVERFDILRLFDIDLNGSRIRVVVVVQVAGVALRL